MIAEAEAKGACKEALEWLRAEPRTLDEAVQNYSSWMIEHWPELLNDEQFEQAAKADPWEALKYAAHRLSDEQFERAAKAEPWAALDYAAGRYNKLIG